MNHIRFVALLCMFSSMGLIPITANAVTVAELQAQVELLLAQIETLKTQQSQGSSTTGTTQPLVPLPPTVTRTLSRGARGEDVRSLQQFLIPRGHLAADSATGYFGALTEIGVQKYQQTEGIVSSGTPQTTGFGLVGPSTRARMQRNTSVATNSTATQTGAAVPQVLQASTTTSASSGSVIAITRPIHDSFVQGNAYTINTETKVNDVNQVEFKINGTVVATDTSAPFAYVWDTTKTPNGPHFVTVTARRTDGTTGSATVWVTVWNSDVTSSSASQVSIGTRETVDTMKFIDSQFPMIEKDGEKFWFVSLQTEQHNWEWTKYRGTLTEPFKEAVWKKPAYEILGFPTPPADNMNTPYDHVWLIKTYQVPGTSEVLGIVHIERKPDDASIAFFRGRFGIVWSKDYGDTWKYVGDIIQPQNQDKTGNPVGGPSFIKDGHIYFYYHEAARQGDGSFLYSTVGARADYNAVLAAARRGAVQPWHKYYRGKWESPGIGGFATPLIPWTEGHTSTDGAYSTYNNKMYMILTKSGNTQTGALSTAKIFESEDGIKWKFLKLIDSLPPVQAGVYGSGTGYNGYHYQPIVNADGTDNGVIGRLFYVYGVIFGTGAEHPIVRWLVNLDTSFVPEKHLRSNEFSATRGANGWHYQVFNTDGAYVDMTWNTTKSHWEADEGNAFVTAGGLRPGTNSDIIFKWVAPRAGTVDVTGKVTLTNTTACGDGVQTAILNSGNVLWSQRIREGDTAGAEHMVTKAVKAGEAIHFKVSRLSSNACDATFWNPMVTYQ